MLRDGVDGYWVTVEVKHWEKVFNNLTHAQQVHQYFSQLHLSDGNVSGVYDGEEMDGTKHGQGTYTFASGSVYRGGWSNDLMEGEGTFTFPNGEQHSGSFKQGKKHGRGTYTYANGDVYTGEWSKGKKQGKGTRTCRDGVFDEEWEQDEKVSVHFIPQVE